MNVRKRSQEPKEATESQGSLETSRKSFVFAARKQDILLGNVQIKRKLKLSSRDFDVGGNFSFVSIVETSYVMEVLENVIFHGSIKLKHH